MYIKQDSENYNQFHQITPQGSIVILLSTPAFVSLSSDWSRWNFQPIAMLLKKWPSACCYSLSMHWWFPVACFEIFILIIILIFPMYMCTRQPKSTRIYQEKAWGPCDDSYFSIADIYSRMATCGSQLRALIQGSIYYLAWPTPTPTPLFFNLRKNI